jgi:hypothetical protein
MLGDEVVECRELGSEPARLGDQSLDSCVGKVDW